MELDKIHCSDCLDFMAGMPDECVDLVLTDPPFGQGRMFANDLLNDVDLRTFLSQVALSLHRIVRFNLCLEVPKNKLPLFLDVFSCFRYEYALALYTTNDMRNGKVGFQNFGLVLWFSKERRPINRYRDLIAQSLVNNKKDFTHPTPKNVGHYQRLVAMFSNPGETVCDPFIGSGTAALAAIRENRHYIGIELEQKYVDIANERIRQENAQLKFTFSS